MPIFVTDNALIGNYSVATNFVVLITFFATPVTTMMLPAFSKLDFRRDQEILQNVFQYSVKYAALIVVPVATMVMALSQPAIGTIFGDSYLHAPLFLSLLSITYLLSSLGSLSIGNLINSQGDTKYNLKLAILQASVGFPLSFFMISQFGIIGLIITTIIVAMPGLFLSVGFIKKRYQVSLDWKSSAKILVSSSVTAILTYFVISWLPFSAPITLVVGVLVFMVVFLVTAIATKTISREDIEIIRKIVSGLGPLRKPLTLIFNIIEKLMPKQN